MIDLDDALMKLGNADKASDPVALAAVGWDLFGALGEVRAQLDALRAQCREVPAEAWPVHHLPAAAPT